MTANDWPAKLALSKPRRPLALEVSPKVTLVASEPAALAVTATLAVVPARMPIGEVRVRRPLAVAAATSRLSWKAAEVLTVLVTPRAAPSPTRTLPRANVEAANVARARS